MDVRDVTTLLRKYLKFLFLLLFCCALYSPHPYPLNVAVRTRMLGFLKGPTHGQTVCATQAVAQTDRVWCGLTVCATI
jgi:hypothetical protein